MQAHFVHKNNEGQLAVVGIFLKKGKKNPFIQTLWDEMPHEVNQEQTNNRVQISGAKLLPANGSYYHFSGSLTTPPCSEDVQWYVLKTPVEISAGQIKQFVSAVGHNARPTQPLNDREVIEVKTGSIVFAHMESSSHSSGTQHAAPAHSSSSSHEPSHSSGGHSASSASSGHSSGGHEAAGHEKSNVSTTSKHKKEYRKTGRSSSSHRSVRKSESGFSAMTWLV